MNVLQADTTSLNNRLSRGSLLRATWLPQMYSCDCNTSYRRLWRTAFSLITVFGAWIRARYYKMGHNGVYVTFGENYWKFAYGSEVSPAVPAVPFGKERLDKTQRWELPRVTVMWSVLLICSRGKKLSAVFTVLALNCVMRAAAEGRSWAQCWLC